MPSETRDIYYFLWNKCCFISENKQYKARKEKGKKKKKRMRIIRRDTTEFKLGYQKEKNGQEFSCTQELVLYPILIHTYKLWDYYGTRQNNVVWCNGGLVAPDDLLFRFFFFFLSFFTNHFSKQTNKDRDLQERVLSVLQPRPCFQGSCIFAPIVPSKLTQVVKKVFSMLFHLILCLGTLGRRKRKQRI